MTSLAAKYDYFSSLTLTGSRPQSQKATKRANVRDGKDIQGGPLKKKNKQKPTKANNKNKDARKPAPTVKKAKENKNNAKKLQNAHPVKVPNENEVKVTQKGMKTEGFSALDILKKQLHHKIEESRGQGPPKDPSSEEVQKKRAKRKQERERKKRKRKEFRMKKLAKNDSTEIKEEIKTEQEPEPEPSSAASKAEHKKDLSAVVFNKVEVGEEYVDKATKLKEKKNRKIKGALTPLTGKNFKQLLSRVEARKARLEELREKDVKKAEKEEQKMRWTNVLYKAEGLKIKDNEKLLRASLKRKENKRVQRKKKWAERSQHVVEKMQQRQDKRRRNIDKSKQNKMEKRKQRARKKGRILPEDLKQQVS